MSGAGHWCLVCNGAARTMRIRAPRQHLSTFCIAGSLASRHIDASVRRAYFAAITA